MSRPVDVAVVGSATSDLVRSLRADVVLASADPAVFDGASDRWVIGDVAARVLIDTTPQTGTRTGLLDDDTARTRFGAHPYLGMARHGFPNHFTVTDEDAARYVSACLTALWARGCTRIEVKPHVQGQYSRQVDAGIARSRRKARRTPDLAEYEFTSARDRDEDDEDYRGPAVLIAADGTEVAVQVHLLALYQPVDNMVRWSGRIQPSPGLARLHRDVNQPVQIRIDGRPPVPAILVDHDPWGGSHIVGEGHSPYPLPLLAELALLDG
ncbi:DUF4873 domain-containing protein [Mycobacterium aquaticum]|uniref:DUF4873 domain-containing protein n=1 Tax=Mycobacterium aquaticum TaxID=1927124 RepID=A0A1W9ZVS3_9MYCO|nr:DUF4873 domain-containing protein [Mycobacterium aquaticum]ORA21765.1 hypothetical protein BST13_37080 [Mycobacterium aquaticum]